MSDSKKTKAELIRELKKLRNQAAKLEKLAADRDALQTKLKTLNKNFRTFKKIAEENDTAFQHISMELSIGISEVLDALKKISSGDPSVRIPESSEIEAISKLKQTVNLTAKEIAEIVDQSHDFAIDLAEYFDVLNKVSKGNLEARVTGNTRRELSSALKKVTNEMIDSISREITERKRAEEEIRKMEAMEASLLSAIPHAVIGLRERIIIFANEAVKKVFGWQPEELIGKSTRILYRTDDDYDKIGRIFYPALEKQHIHSLEFPFRKKDGKEIICKASASVIGEKLLDKKVVVMYEDITQQKEDEESRRTIENRLKEIVEHSNELFYVHDTNHKLTYISPRSLEILGYTPEEMMIEWTKLITDSPINPLGIEITEKAIHTGEKQAPYLLELFKKDGGRALLEIDESPIKDSEGKVVGISGAARDVTEKMQSEQALRESEEKFRAISSTAVDAILMMDNDGKITYWNPAAEKMFGYSSKEALGKELHTFLAPKRYHKDYKKGFKNFRLTGNGPAVGNTLEFYALRKDGTEFPIDVSTSALLLDHKWCAVGIVRDITERKRAEQALQDSEQKYRSLFEESKDVVFISTPEGKFLDINPAGIDLFGYNSKEELLQISIPNDLYVYPIDRIKCQQILEREGFVKDHEVLFKRKDGKHVSLLMTNTAVRNEKDKIIMYRGILKDITERKRLEQQLLQAQKMEAIGQLAGGIAHDFNNILTAIIGYGNLLKMQLGEETTLKNYITYILDSAEKAAKLTQDLLAFSRRQMINPQPVNLNVIIHKIEKLLSRLIGEDVELEISLSADDLIVMADSTQIEQALMNLATNSRDAMPEGGKLSIKTESKELTEEFLKAYGYYIKPGKYALLTFEDTGEGMDEKIKEKIFEPFFTTKEIGKGTGLGLSIVYGLVKQHDGYINVYSEPGSGTIFKIYLPLVKLKPEKTFPKDTATVKGGTEAILLAEDDIHVRKLMKEVLLGCGYDVFDAADGEDALKVYSENKEKIQLLILDAIMPKKNGKEVYDEIKTGNPRVKAIFTSGYNSDIIHKKGILQEGLTFVVKPVSPYDLLRKVREVLDSS